MGLTLPGYHCPDAKCNWESGGFLFNLDSNSKAAQFTCLKTFFLDVVHGSLVEDSSKTWDVQMETFEATNIEQVHQYHALG